MLVGNGGDAGFIRYDEMQVPVNKYGFAVACTVSFIYYSVDSQLTSFMTQNTGHDGDSGDGSFAYNNPESQIDFGYRAVSNVLLQAFRLPRRSGHVPQFNLHCLECMVAAVRLNNTS
jgi:hypothetical protein